MISIAIIFTCYNRKEKTGRCLDAIEKEIKLFGSDATWEVYACDDGSTDGTKELLSSSKLNIKVIEGKGLYWDKGMHAAMTQAVNTKHDYYLMINDDVEFFTGFIGKMIASYIEAGESCGISGATKGLNSEETTYGGKKFWGKSFIDPNGKLQECNLANWNCFLVDQNVIDKIGIIDPGYVHSYGDYDYSIQMQRHGMKVFLAKEYIGKCDRNSEKGTFKDKTLSRKERFRLFKSPKGLPFKSGMRYAVKNRDYLGIKGVVVFVGAYCKNLISVALG